MPNLQNLLKFLIKSPLDFVLVGGLAAVIHGCNQTTRDIDICLILSPEKIQALRGMLRPIHPKLRTSKEKLSFLEFPKELTDVKSLYLETDLGVLDAISHVEGIGGFYDVLKHAKEIRLFDGICHVISIDDLIKSKKALGRHRDLIVVEELEAIKKNQ